MYFPLDYYLCDEAIFASLKIAEIASKQKDFAQYLDSLLRYYASQEIFIDSSVISGMVLFLIGLAAIFTYILAIKHVPEAVAKGIFMISAHPLFFLMISNAVLIVLGCILEGIPAVIIFLPIFLPICEQLGINMVHYGILVVASIGIGLFLPPVGVGLVIACSICNVSMKEVMKPMMIFIGCLVIGLIILTIFPWFTTFLPDLILK